VKPGTVFRHARLLDTSWTPGPGQSFKDAPKVLCRVTATRKTALGVKVYVAIGEDGRHAHRYFYLDNAEKSVGEIIYPGGTAACQS
jgi:hypothetical protein